MNKNLKSLTLKQLSKIGEKPYNGIQIYRWIWKRGEENINNFTDISKNLRNKLIQEGYFVGKIKEVNRIYSSDGSIKFVFEDGYEAVYMPDNDRITVCVWGLKEIYIFGKLLIKFYKLVKLLIKELRMLFLWEWVSLY